MRKAIAAAAGIACALVAAAPAQADSYDDMFAAADYLAQKYGVMVYTDYAPMEYGTYAVTQGDLITFNQGYIENPDLLWADMTADVMAGYHPGLDCTPEQAVTAHEFAHVLDNLTGHTTDAELEFALANGFGGEVSGYSLTNIDEAIADAFLAVECDTPTGAESAIYTMLTT